LGEQDDRLGAAEEPKMWMSQLAMGATPRADLADANWDAVTKEAFDVDAMDR
jgi:hypothetical protein